MKNLTLGDKIRGIRTLKGYSQENMAEMLGLSLPAYGDIERGKKDVAMQRMEQIAEKLEVSVSDILNFGEKVQNFFENCNSISLGTNNTHKGNNIKENYKGNEEFIHQLEKADLEKQILQLEIEKLKAEKEKAEIEAKYWREKAEQ